MEQRARATISYGGATSSSVLFSKPFETMFNELRYILSASPFHCSIFALSRIQFSVHQVGCPCVERERERERESNRNDDSFLSVPLSVQVHVDPYLNWFI